MTTRNTRTATRYEYQALTLTEFRIYKLLVSRNGGILSAGTIAGQTTTSKTSAARALAALVAKGYIGREQVVVNRYNNKRSRKTETQVCQRRRVYKYRIYSNIRDGVFRGNSLYINNAVTTDKKPLQRTPSIRSYKYYNYKFGRKVANYIARRDMVRVNSKQREMIDVGERRKPRRKSRAGELAKIIIREHRRAFGNDNLPVFNRIDFIFINKTLNNLEGFYKEIFHESTPEEQADMLRSPAFGEMFKSKMTFVRFLEWSVKELYATEIPKGEYPFLGGFRDVKNLIHHAAAFRMIHRYCLHCRDEQWRRRRIVGSSEAK